MLWRNCLPSWANQANCLQHAPALAGATCGGPGDRVGSSCEEAGASYEAWGVSMPIPVQTQRAAGPLSFSAGRRVKPVKPV